MKKNQSLEKALSIQATPTKIAERPTSLANEKNSYWSIGVGLLSSPRMEKDFTVFAGANSVRGSAELDFDSAFSVNLKWSQNYKQKWNHGVNLSYSQLDLKNAKLDIANSSTSGKAEGELNILTISYAGSLRFTDFYIPTYIGSSSGKFKSNNELIETITTRIFLAGGAGFIINEHFHVEGTFNFHSTYSPGKTLNTGSGTLRFIPDVGSLSYLHLVAKFVF